MSELKDGQVTTRDINPADFGMEAVDAERLKGGDAAINAQILRDVLDGKGGPQTDMPRAAAHR